MRRHFSMPWLRMLQQLARDPTLLWEAVTLDKAQQCALENKKNLVHYLNWQIHPCYALSFSM